MGELAGDAVQHAVHAVVFRDSAERSGGHRRRRRDRRPVPRHRPAHPATLALQTPVAADLRLVSAIIHMNLHLERVGGPGGEHREDAPADRWTSPAATSCAGSSRRWATWCVGWCARAMEAFERRDLDLCLQLPEMDDPVDRLNRAMLSRSAEAGRRSRRARLGDPHERRRRGRSSAWATTPSTSPSRWGSCSRGSSGSSRTPRTRSRLVSHRRPADPAGRGRGALCRSIRYSLDREGYAGHVARRRASAPSSGSASTEPALVILDLMLPEAVRPGRRAAMIRQESTVPIVILTAKDSEADKVTGLELGADDYVTKPFSMRELDLARPRAPAPRARWRGRGDPRRRAGGRPGRDGRRRGTRCASAARPSRSRPRSSSCWRRSCERKGRLADAAAS